MQLPVDAISLIPHRKPMCIVDRLMESDGKAGWAESTFPIDSPFVDRSGKIDRLILLELIAQSYASAKGYEDLRDGGKVSRGFLVGISKAAFLGDAVAGERLVVNIRTEETFDNFFIALGEVFQKDTLVLQATLKIWLAPDSTP